MKKINIDQNRLSLGKTKVSNLTNDEMGKVKGGAEFLSLFTCHNGTSHCRRCDSCCEDTDCSGIIIGPPDTGGVGDPQPPAGS